MKYTMHVTEEERAAILAMRRDAASRNDRTNHPENGTPRPEFGGTLAEALERAVNDDWTLYDPHGPGGWRVLVDPRGVGYRCRSVDVQWAVLRLRGVVPGGYTEEMRHAAELAAQLHLEHRRGEPMPPDGAMSDAGLEQHARGLRGLAQREGAR